MQANENHETHPTNAAQQIHSDYKRIVRTFDIKLCNATFLVNRLECLIIEYKDMYKKSLY